MNDQLNANVRTCAMRAAEFEVSLERAEDHHTAAANEAASLNRRVDAANADIQSLRSTATARDLTDKEAAALNLAILDVTDLQRMATEAEARRRSAASVVEPMRVSLKAAQRDLICATGMVRYAVLIEEVRAKEAELCDKLMGLWGALRAANPHARFVDAWIAGDGLKRAVMHNQPPAMGSIS